MKSEGLEKGQSANIAGKLKQLSQGWVCKLDPPVFIQDEQSFHHAVEHGLLLGLLVRQTGTSRVAEFLEIPPAAARARRSVISRERSTQRFGACQCAYPRQEGQHREAPAWARWTQFSMKRYPTPRTVSR